jgi:hypothetical protein
MLKSYYQFFSRGNTLKMIFYDLNMTRRIYKTQSITTKPRLDGRISNRQAHTKQIDNFRKTKETGREKKKKKSKKKQTVS